MIDTNDARRDDTRHIEHSQKMKMRTPYWSFRHHRDITGSPLLFHNVRQKEDKQFVLVTVTVTKSVCPFPGFALWPLAKD
jgi:hypothetical protein